MQIQVFIGDAGDGKINKLHEIHSELIAMGKTPSIINAAIFGDYGFMDVVEAHVESGHREILADFCSCAQIMKVLEWRSSVEHDPGFDDLVIHLARKG